MRTIKIPFPDVAFYEKTRLWNPDKKVLEETMGTDVIYVRNLSGINEDDYIVIEAFESEEAEIVQVKSMEKDTHLIELYAPIYETHSIGVVVMKTPYNKVKVYKGTTNDTSLHTEVSESPLALRPDVAYTYYVDPVGLITDFYSYAYYKTKPSINTINRARSSNIATIRTELHKAAVGDQIVISGLGGTGYNGIWTVLFVPDSIHLSFICTGSDELETADTGGTIAIGSTTSRTLYEDSDYDAILTVQNLKDWFMFGLDLTDDDGYPFPNSMFEFAIRAAVDSLEKTLQIKLKPTSIFEYQDFYSQDYRDFSFIQLNNWPVINVEKIQIKYPTGAEPIEFPIEWVQLRTERGSLHLVPTQGSLSTILIGRGGDYLTFVWRGYDFMPNLWRIWYTAGFPVGRVPNDLIAVVGKMACFYPLNIAGDLVGGIAIASKSIGVDGLSQSINTTSSAENAGYSARLRQYERELKIEIPRLVQFYKAMRMAVL